MQRAIAILTVTCQAVQHFSILFYKKHYFQEKVTDHKMCALIFSAMFVLSVFHSKKNMIKKIILVSKQSICYSCQILMKLEFSG
jgi:hypothetical protein